MINYTALLFILLEPVLAGTGAGWFASIRGGQLNQHPNSIYIYPRALSNIGYAYGHLKDDDNDAGNASKHERKDIVNVKSTSTTQQDKKKWSDNEFEEEDHFFHSLYHNDDENDNKVVTNVSTKKNKNEDHDVILFGRLNDRLFHRRRGNSAQVQHNKHKEEDGAIDSDNVAHLKYGIEEAFKEFTLFE